MGQNSRALQHAVAMPKKYPKKNLGKKRHSLTVPNSWFGAAECCGFFVEFLGYVLVGDCV